MPVLRAPRPSKRRQSKNYPAIALLLSGVVGVLISLISFDSSWTSPVPTETKILSFLLNTATARLKIPTISAHNAMIFEISLILLDAHDTEVGFAVDSMSMTVLFCDNTIVILADIVALYVLYAFSGSLLVRQ